MHRFRARISHPGFGADSLGWGDAGAIGSERADQITLPGPEDRQVVALQPFGCQSRGLCAVPDLLHNVGGQKGESGQILHRVFGGAFLPGNLGIGLARQYERKIAMLRRSVSSRRSCLFPMIRCVFTPRLRGLNGTRIVRYSRFVRSTFVAIQVPKYCRSSATAISPGAMSTRSIRPNATRI